MESYRAVFEHPPEAPVRIRVIGFHEPFREAVHTAGGMGEWFLAILHTPQPVLTAQGWETTGAGDLIISSPGTPICHGGDPLPFERSWVRCSGNAMPRLVAEAGLPTERRIPCDAPALHDGWLETLRAECQHPRGADQRNVRDLVGCWLRSVRRCASGLAPAAGSIAMDAKRIIDRAYRSDLDLSDLVERLGTSRSTLCRAFRDAYGMAPMAYLRQLRMTQAEDLLLGTDLPIGAVAERCGFSDVYYFSRAFRKTHGRPPSAFRKAGAGPRGPAPHTMP